MAWIYRNPNTRGSPKKNKPLTPHKSRCHAKPTRPSHQDTATKTKVRESHAPEAGDLARGIVKCIMHPKSRNEDLRFGVQGLGFR